MALSGVHGVNLRSCVLAVLPHAEREAYFGAAAKGFASHTRARFLLLWPVSGPSHLRHAEIAYNVRVTFPKWKSAISLEKFPSEMRVAKRGLGKMREKSVEIPEVF